MCTVPGKKRMQAVIDEIARIHQRKQPILVGTKDICDSEELSARLNEAGIPHLVLTASRIRKKHRSLHRPARREL